jgi:hypothetical protein
MGFQMSDLTRQCATSLPSEDVIVRAVQYFSTQNWRPVSQSARVATFQGKPPIPWFMLLLTFLGFVACMVPGIIMYVLVIRKLYRFHNLIITTNPINGGSEIYAQYPESAAWLVSGFMATLPPQYMAGHPSDLPTLPGTPSQPNSPAEQAPPFPENSSGG